MVRWWCSGGKSLGQRTKELFQVKDNCRKRLGDVGLSKTSVKCCPLSLLLDCKLVTKDWNAGGHLRLPLLKG